MSFLSALSEQRTRLLQSLKNKQDNKDIKPPSNNKEVDKTNKK